MVVLLATGTIATIDHMPALDALWETGYGVAILVKIGILLVAMVLAAGNLLRTTPAAGRRARSTRRCGVGRRVAAAAAGRRPRRCSSPARCSWPALLSSLAPPPPAFALQNSALAHRRPRPGRQDGARATATCCRCSSPPTRRRAPDSFALRITKDGQPVRHANVTLTFNQTEMQMPQQEYQLAETQPGVYSRTRPGAGDGRQMGLGFTRHPAGRRRRSPP